MTTEKDSRKLVNSPTIEEALVQMQPKLKEIKEKEHDRQMAWEKAWRIKNREHVLEYARRYNKKRRAKKGGREYERAYYQKHKDRINARCRKRYRENKLKEAGKK